MITEKTVMALNQGYSFNKWLRLSQTDLGYAKNLHQKGYGDVINKATNSNLTHLSL